MKKTTVLIIGVIAAVVIYTYVSETSDKTTNYVPQNQQQTLPQQQQTLPQQQQTLPQQQIPNQQLPVQSGGGNSSSYYYSMADQYLRKAEAQESRIQFCKENLDNAIQNGTGTISAQGAYDAAVNLYNTYINTADRFRQMGDNALAAGK